MSIELDWLDSLGGLVSSMSVMSTISISLSKDGGGVSGFLALGYVGRRWSRAEAQRESREW